LLKWDSTLYYNQTINLVAKWYDKFYNSDSNNDLYKFTLDQITEYENIALDRKKSWCN